MPLHECPCTSAPAGSESLPSSGPALLLFYHGALPVDYYFLVADTLLYRDRSLIPYTSAMIQ